MELSVILAGAATGIVLGLFGSGGSIIALPALLYLLHASPKSAIAMSLGIVTPVVIQLGLFALVMYAAAWKMLHPSANATPAAIGVSVSGGAAVMPCHDFFSPCMGHIALHGIGVGVLTGLVGVGGGFLIVPALVLLSGVPMKTAVGTSLAIVAAKSYAGFAGYYGAVPIDWPLMASFTAVTVAGSFVGTYVAERFSAASLKRAFAIFLLVVATYILLKSVIFGAA